MKIFIFIQSRFSSTRLPGKALLHLKGLPIVEWAYKRVAKGFPNTYILTSKDSSDDILEEYFKIKEINFFRGDLKNVLKRFYDASTKIGGIQDEDLIVRLTADNIFPDESFLKLMIDYFQENQCDYLTSSKPESKLPYGLSAEIFKYKYLKQAYKNATTAYEKEHVTPWIIKAVPLTFLKLPNYPNYSHFRVTIDTLEDFLTMTKFTKNIDNLLEAEALDLCKGLEKYD